jgi:hypothetical protein
LGFCGIIWVLNTTVNSYIFNKMIQKFALKLIKF